MARLSRLHSIEHREGAEVASANQAVVNEVDRPGLIRRHRSLACHPQMAQPLAPAPSAQRQPFFAIQPLDSFVIGPPALAAQHQIEHRTTPAPSFFRQFAQALPQSAIAIFRRCALQTRVA